MTDGSSNVAFQIRILQHVTCGVAVKSKCIVQRSLLFECHSGTQDMVSFKNPLYLESVLKALLPQKDTRRRGCSHLFSCTCLFDFIRLHDSSVP